MTRTIDLDVHLNRLAGGVARVWSGVVSHYEDHDSELGYFEEVIQVTAGKKLIIYQINVHYRSTGAATGGISFILDERDDEPNAAVDNADAIVICDNMFSNNASDWKILNFRGCPIIGGVNQSLYALGENSNPANRPPTYVWYDEI